MSSYQGKHETTANQLVDEMLNGFQAANPGAIKIHVDCGKLLVRTFQKSGCVSVVSGGRAGNEPFPSGFVGTGMLSAALYGEDLNPPAANDISKSIGIIAGDTIGTDILLIAPKNIANLENFTSGAEMAMSKKIKVSSVFVGKEHKEQNSDPSWSPIEDMLSVILIFKIAGAMAMEGKHLDVILSTLEDIISLQTTFEVNITSISLRGPIFELEKKLEHDIEDDDMDLPGVGIQDMKLECSLNDDILKKVKEKCNSILIEQGNEVAVLVNIMDSTLQMVQWIFIARIEKELSKNGIKVARFYSGNIVSSDVKGRLQVCIIKLGRDDKEKEQWLSWLDAPTSAPAWPGGMQSIRTEVSPLPFENFIIKQNLKLINEVHSMKYKSTFYHHEAQLAHSCIERTALALIDAEDRLNALEEKHKIFKCGTTMKIIAEAILENLDNLPTGCPVDLLHCIARICESQGDDDLGLVCAIFFTAAIPPLIFIEKKADDLLWAEAWGRAFRSGIKGISRFYGPKQGKKTLVDLLTLVCTKCESSPKGDILEVISALNSCFPHTNECESIDRVKIKDSNESELEKLGYDAEACAVEVCLRAIIKEISLHLSNSI